MCREDVSSWGSPLSRTVREILERATSQHGGSFSPKGNKEKLVEKF